MKSPNSFSQKLINFLLIICIITVMGSSFSCVHPSFKRKELQSVSNGHGTEARHESNLYYDVFLPAIQSSDQIIKHFAYSISYNEKYEIANWVAYTLTDNHVGGLVKRRDNFRIDPSVVTGSATKNDYKGSGFDRGHLAPAADFKWLYPGFPIEQNGWTLEFLGIAALLKEYGNASGFAQECQRRQRLNRLNQ